MIDFSICLVIPWGKRQKGMGLSFRKKVKVPGREIHFNGKERGGSGPDLMGRARP